MSVLAWAEPPTERAPRAKRKYTKSTVLYELPKFPEPQPGAIADVRWTYDFGTQAKHCGAITEAFALWLDENPDHWVLAGTYAMEASRRKMLSGYPSGSLHGRNILHALRDGSIYARSRLGLDGMSVEDSLDAALDVQQSMWTRAELPKLTKDPFGWTDAELTSAVAAARDWLYPTEAIAA